MLHRSWMILVCLFLFTGTALAEFRVKGAELLGPNDKIEDRVPDLIKLEITQAEIDLFLNNIDAVVAWAKANSEEWHSVDEAENPLPVMHKLGVWDTVDITPGEFIAVIMKLEFAKSLVDGELDVTQLKGYVTMLEGMLAEAPEEDKAGVEKNLGDAKELVTSVENYPEGNGDLFKKNRDAVEAAIDKFNAIDKEAAEDQHDAPPKGGEAEDEAGK